MTGAPRWWEVGECHCGQGHLDAGIGGSSAYVTVNNDKGTWMMEDLGRFRYYHVDSGESCSPQAAGCSKAARPTDEIFSRV
jgi:hypothetical protein